LNCDSGVVGGGNEAVAIEEKRLACVESKCCGVRTLHDINSLQADYGNIEAHILRGLAHFDDDDALAAGDSRGALDGFVGAFHGFDGDAGAIADDDGLAEIEGGDLLGDVAAVGDVGGFGLIGRAAREDSFRGQERTEKFRRVYEFDAFVMQDSGDCAD
jgi:hypothetical protein